MWIVYTYLYIKPYDKNAFLLHRLNCTQEIKQTFNAIVLTAINLFRKFEAPLIHKTSKYMEKMNELIMKSYVANCDECTYDTVVNNGIACGSDRHPSKMTVQSYKNQSKSNFSPFSVEISIFLHSALTENWYVFAFYRIPVQHMYRCAFLFVHLTIRIILSVLVHIAVKLKLHAIDSNFSIVNSFVHVIHTRCVHLAFFISPSNAWFSLFHSFSLWSLLLCSTESCFWSSFIQIQIQMVLQMILL